MNLSVGDRVILAAAVAQQNGKAPIPVGALGIVRETKVVGTTEGDLPMGRVEWDGWGLDGWRSLHPASVVQPAGAPR